MTAIILFGGPSDERHVSVASAQNVVRALGNPLAWFWAPDGPVHDVSVDDLLSHQRPFEIDFQPRRPAIWPNIEQALDTLPVEDPVFVLALHGGGGELTVGVVDRNGKPFALPVLEVEVDAGRAFDYVGKYLGSGAREICPANISDRMRDAAQKVGIAAHTTLGCVGYSRTDVVATEDDIYFIELNNLP